MPKKVKKRIKFKLIPIFFLVCFCTLTYFFLSYLVDTKIKNIYIYGNNILKDQEIIELAKIENYPSFYKTFSINIRKNIEKNPIVKEVKVKKRFFNVLKIYVTEYVPLVIKDNKTILENGIAIDKIIPKVPTLTNMNNDEVYNLLLNELIKLDAIEKNQISQIIYSPSEYDNTRFLLYMNDGNHIYININKFKNLDYYNEIYPTLNNKKGTLYLDSGNHFEVFK